MTHHGAALARESGQPALAGTVVSGEFDKLPERTRLLCTYALKLTVSPWDVSEADLAALREGGFEDRDIVDANQVVAYFNYVNRVAHGLGVELEERWNAKKEGHRPYPLWERRQ